jgi:hypothetical protein
VCVCVCVCELSCGGNITLVRKGYDKNCLHHDLEVVSNPVAPPSEQEETPIETPFAFYSGVRGLHGRRGSQGLYSEAGRADCGQGGWARGREGRDRRHDGAGASGKLPTSIDDPGSAILDLEMAAGWACPSSRGLCGGDALLLGIRTPRVAPGS